MVSAVGAFAPLPLLANMLRPSSNTAESNMEGYR